MRIFLTDRSMTLPSVARCSNYVAKIDPKGLNNEVFLVDPKKVRFATQLLHLQLHCKISTWY